MEAFTVNHERAEEVFTVLLHQFRTRSFPYEGAKTPQDLVDLSALSKREQSLFWWHVCYFMYGAIDSNDATLRLEKFYKKEPRYFEPETTMNMRPEELAEVLSAEVLSNDALNRARRWVKNAGPMHTRFGGDPRNVFCPTRSYEDLVTLIVNDPKRKLEGFEDFSGFFGFQEKMTGMIIYFLSHQELIERRPYIAAVDFHLLRIMLMTGVVVPSSDVMARPYFRYIEPLKAARDALRKFTNMDPTVMTDLADALWLLSRNLCAESPKNSLPEYNDHRDAKYNANRIRRGLEPTPESPQLAFALEERFDFNTWLRQTTQKMKILKSCGRCQISSHCGFKLPAAPVYQADHYMLQASDIRDVLELRPA